MSMKKDIAMKKVFLSALAATTFLSAGVAAAQPYYGGGQQYQRGYRDTDRDGRSDRREWNRDRDRDGRPDQFDRRDNRRDGQRYDNQRGYRYYGGQNGYQGYRGQWRTGQRFPYYNQRRYVIDDYRRYGLPAPHRGYRYYRDDNGDVVMAAIASGIIGLIIGGALSDGNNGYGQNNGYGYGYGQNNGYYNNGY